MLRSFNDRGIIKDFNHDIFNPYKLLRSDLSGRYFIEDITKLKKVMKKDFINFPDDTFGVLDVSIISHTKDRFTEQKELNSVVEYLSSLPINAQIDLYNDQHLFTKDNMNYIINEKDIYVYKQKKEVIYRYGRTSKSKEDIYKTFIIENDSDIDIKLTPPDEGVEFGWGNVETKIPLNDYFQGVSVMYTFYASNGGVYNAQVKLDDAIVEVASPHTFAIQSQEIVVRKFKVKAIIGASVFAVSPNGEIYDYFMESREGNNIAPGELEKSKEFKERKVLLQIYFKSTMTTDNALSEQLYNIEDMKKEMVLKNEVDIPTSKYNFRRNRVITRAAYLIGGTWYDKNNIFYADAIRISRTWNYSRPHAYDYYYNVGAYWRLDDYAMISGYAGDTYREFMYPRGFPTENDVFTNYRWYQDIIDRIRWRNQEYFSYFEEHDPDKNRMLPTAENAYGLYADLYGFENSENNIHRGFYFRLELKGEPTANDAIFAVLPIGQNVQRVGTYGNISNFILRDDNFSRSPNCPYKYTHFIFPYKENHKYLIMTYPCVNWFSFPFHRRGFDKSTVVDINKAQNINARYKWIQGMYGVRTHRWNFKDTNIALWCTSRSPLVDGPRAVFGYASDKEDINPSTPFYDRGKIGETVNLQAF